MRILYVGDIMGEVGIATAEETIPQLKEDRDIDLVIAQGENVTGGRGITPEDFLRLSRCAIDFCTGGNWSLNHSSIVPLPGCGAVG
jgi:2',3'-cyclic-nucleotide 2'-phosphodiesterase